MNNFPKKILIIDDNPQDIELVRIYLRMNGFNNAVFALTGDEGIGLISEEKPDLIVVDASLPGLHGYEVVKQIRQSYKNIKIGWCNYWVR